MKLAVYTLLIVLGEALNAYAQSPEPVPPSSLKTRWTDQVTADSVLPEYPRPQMIRGGWQNLNGLWEYVIKSKDASAPAIFEGKILVPFPLESALSGVKKALLPTQKLWYRRQFHMNAVQEGKRILLHFGAVDQQAVVYVNGKQAGTHSGGYDPFELDITGLLQPGNNELMVGVWDPSDTGEGPHGKQTLQPRRIFYTAVSGIWQTVWLEAVPATAIAALSIMPEVDSGFVHLQVEIKGKLFGYTVEAAAKDGGEILSRATAKPGTSFKLSIPRARLWSPDDPHLYDLAINLRYKGKITDAVRSYFGMRKITIRKDEKGMERIFLNDRYTYNLGVLDQGYWPDGLYTAPTDEALAFDIQAIKDMGFNTIRKHIKIEPARWYYHCDRLGMLVWQDMPSWYQRREMPVAAKVQFEAEAGRHVTALRNHPSIIMWCLFNEDWGSFDQERLAAWMRVLDPSRILNAHSGSFIRNWVGSDLTDLHHYPDPTLPPYQKGKAMVCGEFGGTYAPVPGHEWLAGKGFGHSSPPGFTFLERYEHMTQHLKILEMEGLTGSIFTEPFDVEIEENGLVTYDRAVFKIPVEKVRALNKSIVDKKKLDGRIGNNIIANN
ncbi:sugar-binding domain-containing protein [Chitinophaga sp. YIM B06452]|uniref:glycoside hydrolase family 2 protein n=1 Tax=Chitinophaga sp. YIM B06452 TaxID=3082158 RepID=UPI0031FEE527